MAPRRNTLHATLALLLAGAVVGPASPASADSDRSWKFDGPVAGMPTTDVAARTVEAAYVRVLDGFERDTLHATVTLGGMPDASTDGDLHLVTGVPDGDGCRLAWELVVPTTSATISQAGAATVQLDYPVDAGDWEQWSCIFVSITAVGEPATVYDRWDARYDGEVVLDPGGFVRIKDVHVPYAVRPHRWFPVRVELKNVQSDLDGVRVTGQGVDLRAAPTVIGGMQSGASLTTRLWVRLGTADVRRLQIVTTPYGRIAFAQQDVRTVTVRPR